MQFVAYLVILIGAYVTYAASKFNQPIELAKELIANPATFRETLTSNGDWGTGGTSVPGTADAGGASSGAPPADGSNGNLPDSALVRLSWSPHRLAPAAAAGLEAANAAYRAEFNSNIAVTDGYRSLAGQIKTKKNKGNLAATPGKSVHGLGKAVDLGGGIQVWGSRQHNWFVANGPKFGWVHPAWARKGGSKPEPWHFEFVGG